jgi:hypothetical protein
MFGGSFGTGALYGGVSGGIAGGLAYGAEMNSINLASQQQNIDPDDPWTGSIDELVEKYDRLQEFYESSGRPDMREATAWNINKKQYVLHDNNLLWDKGRGSRNVWGYTEAIGKGRTLSNGWKSYHSRIRIAPATFTQSTRWAVHIVGHELSHAHMNFSGVAWYLRSGGLENRIEDYARHWNVTTARYFGLPVEPWMKMRTYNTTY